VNYINRGGKNNNAMKKYQKKYINARFFEIVQTFKIVFIIFPLVKTTQLLRYFSSCSIKKKHKKSEKKSHCHTAKKNKQQSRISTKSGLLYRHGALSPEHTTEMGLLCKNATSGRAESEFPEFAIMKISNIEYSRDLQGYNLS